jgi:nitrogen fixation NifU-like protein
MYSDRLLQYFREARRAGELAPPAVTVDVSNPLCGDVLRLGVLVQDGVVLEAAFQARGCTATVGCASALTELLVGRPWPAVVTAEEIVAAVDGLPEASRHAAGLCADAVAQAARKR